MPAPVYGDNSRRPVSPATAGWPGLYERTRKDGTTVYDVHARLGGKLRRHTLKAQTKTDAIPELRALQTDYARGEAHRSPSAAVTLAELAQEWLATLRPASRTATRSDATRPEPWRCTGSGWNSTSSPRSGTWPRARSTWATCAGSSTAGRQGLAPGTVTSIVNILSGLLRYGIGWACGAEPGA